MRIDIYYNLIKMRCLLSISFYFIWNTKLTSNMSRFILSTYANQQWVYFIKPSTQLELLSDLDNWFIRVLRFPPPLKLTTAIKWNIVESGVKHHQTDWTLHLPVLSIIGRLTINEKLTLHDPKKDVAGC